MKETLIILILSVVLLCLFFSPDKRNQVIEINMTNQSQIVTVTNVVYRTNYVTITNTLPVKVTTTNNLDSIAQELKDLMTEIENRK